MFGYKQPEKEEPVWLVVVFFLVFIFLVLNAAPHHTTPEWSGATHVDDR